MLTLLHCSYSSKHWNILSGSYSFNCFNQQLTENLLLKPLFLSVSLCLHLSSLNLKHESKTWDYVPRWKQCKNIFLMSSSTSLIFENTQISHNIKTTGSWIKMTISLQCDVPANNHWNLAHKRMPCDTKHLPKNPCRSSMVSITLTLITLVPQQANMHCHTTKHCSYLTNNWKITKSDGHPSNSTNYDPWRVVDKTLFTFYLYLFTYFGMVHGSKSMYMSTRTQGKLL